MVDSAKMRCAREAYVTGEVDSLARAAKKAQLRERYVQQTALDEGWHAERQRYLVAASERARQATIEAEAAMLVDARTRAYRCVKLALDELEDGLKAKRLDVKAARAAREIARMALELSRWGDAVTGDETDAAAEILDLQRRIGAS